MGRRQETITITARLSAHSHNDEQDDVDEALWEELQGRIAALLADERYESISPVTA